MNRRINWVVIWLLAGAFLLLSSGEVNAKRKSKTEKFIDRIYDKIETSQIKTPVSEEVCFSPDQHCEVKLVKFIDSAMQSIDVAIFDLNLDEVVHHLLTKSKTIKVRVVVDRKQASSDHSLVSTLTKAGVEVRYGKQRGIMHNKFIIVDNKILVTGSFNFTNGAAFKNQENQVYLAHQNIVSKYSERFETIWKEFSSSK